MQQTIPFSKVVIDEEQKTLVDQVLASGHIAQGPLVAELEQAMQEITGSSHAVAVSSGTAALILSLRVLGLKPGDEVITGPITFGATVNAILAAGAKVRFADVRSDGTIDSESVASLIGSRTRVLLPIHIYGAPADMGNLMDLAIARDITIVEDAAQAIGGSFGSRPVGSFGLGCFSLYATKNITSAEGGVITTSNQHWAEQLRMLRNQGMSERYEYSRIGFNERMTDLHAALAIPHLRRIDEINGARRANATVLNEGLSGLPGLESPPAVPGHVFHLYTIRVTSNAPVTRDELAQRLADAGIGTGIVYPRLVYDYQCFRTHPRVVTDPVPAAQEMIDEVLSLPVHPHLSERDLERIIEEITTIFT